MPLLEICAPSLQSALNASAGGAHRLELCVDLEVGGLTPSHGLILTVIKRVTIPVHVLIRPRTGDFVYTDDEIQVMLADIAVCKSLGCAGVVVGVLTGDGRVDVQRCERLVEAARPMSVTFHRAFDDCVDQLRALEDVIALGCERILTSGGMDTAVEGIERLAVLVQYAGGRVVVMPGAGVSAGNLEMLGTRTGAVEFHASAKSVVPPAFESRFAAAQLESDVEQIRAMINVMSQL